MRIIRVREISADVILKEVNLEKFKAEMSTMQQGISDTEWPSLALIASPRL